MLLLAPTASLANNAPSPSLLYAFLAASASRAKGISRPFSLRARDDCLADATPPPISLPACAADLANVSHPLPFPRSAATDQAPAPTLLLRTGTLSFLYGVLSHPPSRCTATNTHSP
ncbi:unnamed protein product [Closterium sp. NIES-64]|nr:unnamed protein product [Closterium sp. NIES-64]